MSWKCRGRGGIIIETHVHGILYLWSTQQSDQSHYSLNNPSIIFITLLSSDTSCHLTSRVTCCQNFVSVTVSYYFFKKKSGLALNHVLAGFAICQFLCTESEVGGTSINRSREYFFLLFDFHNEDLEVQVFQSSWNESFFP